MRRRTAVALIACGAVAASATLMRTRAAGSRTDEAIPDEDAVFTVFVPGGPQEFWCNGPGGWLMAKMMPFIEAGVYRR